MRPALAILVLATAPGLATGQTVRLVADLAPGGGSSNPRELAPLPNGVVFVAEDGQHTNLYFSDGTAGGTIVLLANLSSDPPVHQLTASGGRVYFVETKFQYRQDLWVTDGTAAGTTIPRPLTDQWGSYFMGPLFAFQGGVVFSPYFGPYGATVWFSDGTNSGTHGLVSTGNDSQFPHDFCEHRGAAYFGMRTDTYVGDELCRATTAGGSLFRDGDFNGPGVAPSGLASAGEFLYFAARGPKVGREIWRSDGTPEGTIPFIDVEPGSESSDPRELVGIGPRLWFAAYRASIGLTFFVSDGTPEGTHAVPASDGPLLADFPARLRGRVYRLEQQGDALNSVWVSDGTLPGTSRMIGSANIAGFSARGLITAGGRLIISADTPSRGGELWISDGTAGGTTPGPEISAGGGDAAPDHMVAVGRRVFLAANRPDAGRELFVLDLCPADFNHDGVLDSRDRDGFQAAFDAGADAADFDGSGFVDTEDFDGFIKSFEKGC